MTRKGLAREFGKDEFLAECEYTRNLISVCGATFAESFNGIMKIIFDDMNILEHKRAVEFAKCTRLSEKLYGDMKRAKPNYKPKIRNIVAVCAGFNLAITVAERLLASCGLAFDCSDEHQVFRYILTNCRELDIVERSKILKKLGFKALIDD